MKDTKAALKWITDIFKEHNINFIISGGLAAKVYGSTRELADIDVGIDKDYFSEIMPEIKEYIISGPKIYKDEEWDLLLVILNYKGQEIDVCVVDTLKFFNRKEQKWEDMKHVFSDTVVKEIYGMQLPIISKRNLIDYKSKLAREVDLIDVKEMLEADQYSHHSIE